MTPEELVKELADAYERHLYDEQEFSMAAAELAEKARTLLGRPPLVVG